MHPVLDNKDLHYVPGHTIHNKYIAYKDAAQVAEVASKTYKNTAESLKVQKPHDPNDPPRGGLIYGGRYTQTGHQTLAPLARDASISARFHAARRGSFNDKYADVLKANREYNGHVKEAKEAYRSSEIYAAVEQKHRKSSSSSLPTNALYAGPCLRPHGNSTIGGTEFEKEDLRSVSVVEAYPVDSSSISPPSVSDPPCSATGDDAETLATLSSADSSELPSEKESSSQAAEPMLLAATCYREETPYDYELPQLEPSIRNLCLQLWPSAQHGKTGIEFLAEGGYNKVFAISIFKEDGVFDYVIRLPSLIEDIRHSIAGFKYAEKVTDLPAPRVMFYDLTSNNPLNGITYEQRLSIAKDLGRFYPKMLSIKNNRAGTIQANEHGPLGSKIFARIRPIGVHEGDPDVEYRVPGDDNSVCPLMACEDSDKPCNDIMLDAIIMCYARGGGPKGDQADRWMKTSRIFHKMDQMGLFSNNDICLYHSDFFPRNIMVELSDSANSTGDAATVTGILDWNSVMYVPQFLANEPPSFLWTLIKTSMWSMTSMNLRRYELETFGGLATAPPTPEMAEVKRIFEEFALHIQALHSGALLSRPYFKSFTGMILKAMMRVESLKATPSMKDTSEPISLLGLRPQQTIGVNGDEPISDNQPTHESGLRITKTFNDLHNLTGYDKSINKSAEKVSEKPGADAPLKAKEPAGQSTLHGVERPNNEGELAKSNEPSGQTALHIRRASNDENGLFSSDPASCSASEAPLPHDVNPIVQHAQFGIAEDEKARAKEYDELSDSPITPTLPDSDGSGSSIEDANGEKSVSSKSMSSKGSMTSLDSMGEQ
ncbi:hypothetical protein F5Y06DRAFT_297806 [Hypoxylon sp. FL0890]|nr:hypothetical protein F5Y06DRAFT_297806 [Hypoxylon sp. FL0890]